MGKYYRHQSTANRIGTVVDLKNRGIGYVCSVSGKEFLYNRIIAKYVTVLFERRALALAEQWSRRIDARQEIAQASVKDRKSFYDVGLGHCNDFQYWCCCQRALWIRRQIKNRLYRIRNNVRQSIDRRFVAFKRWLLNRPLPVRAAPPLSKQAIPEPGLHSDGIQSYYIEPLTKIRFADASEAKRLTQTIIEDQNDQGIARNCDLKTRAAIYASQNAA